MPSSSGRAAVTGAKGFVGRHLVAALYDTGQPVLELSRAGGFDLLSDDLPGDDITVVYHLAARTFVPAAWDDPVDFHLVNAHGTLRMLEQCRQRKIPMVYVSAYIYGVPETLPVEETAPIRLNNPYGFSKYAGEEACRFYADVFGVPVSIFRLFNVYGPGQDRHFLIPEIMGQIKDPKVAEIRLKDLAPRRDYVHVSDVVDALRLGPALDGLNTFNVGSGRSISVEDIVEAIRLAAGSTKPYRSSGERRPNEVMDVIADISALTGTGLWKPKVGFEDGIRELWKTEFQ